MKEKAKARDFPFAYLYDETQQIARAYGATYTPEFFVLDKDRKIAYMGAMDDKDKADQVKRHWLEEAVEATLKGARPEIGETAGRGCLIRYNKKRR
jgi:peroxiredoxin